MSSFGIDIGAPCCHSLEVLLRVPFRQDLALDLLSPARGLESIKADPDLHHQLHFLKNAVEIRISHRVLCAGCVPETNRSWNSIGELRDAGTNFLKTNFTCVRSVGPH
jgi:hypothetical protein